MEVAGWFVGAGIGTILTALYEGVKKLMGRTTKFKVQLEALELTLESFDLDVIQQIGRHNEALSLPNQDVKALEEKLNEGVRIIGELSDARLWNRMESRYISQLVQLNRSLIVLERRLKMQSIRDVKETRHMTQILLNITLTLHQEPCRDGHGHGSLLSTTRLLDIAPQEALHQILTLDSVRNIASTSTNLRQLHGNGVACVSIQQDSRYLEVIGEGVDWVALVMSLRKRVGAVDIQKLEVVKWEEKPIRRKSKYIKISKWFKRTIPW